jgi:hypothetical protein
VGPQDMGHMQDQKTDVNCACQALQPQTLHLLQFA